MTRERIEAAAYAVRVLFSELPPEERGRLLDELARIHRTRAPGARTTEAE